MSAEPDSAPANGDYGDGKKHPERKRDETPIEELFDLSQPIPRVDRPNKNEHDKELQELTDAVEAIKVERQKIQDKIDKAMEDPDAKSGIQAARSKFNELRTQKNALIEEKKAMRAQLDSIRSQTDKLMKDKKDTKSNVRFGSLAEIEKEIAKLQRLQETTTMTLNEEKKLIKEMDALMVSKKFVVQLKDKDGAIDNVKEQRKSISAQISSKDKEIDALSKQLDETMAIIKGYNEKDTEKRDAIQELFSAREVFKTQIGEKLQEKDAIRDTFREQNNAWFNYQRAVRAQKKIQYEEEKKKRDEEHAAYLAKLEEEEAKKIPYEEEQALCDFLASYLEKTYLNKKDESVSEAKTDVVAVSDDPFKGLKPHSKKDEDSEYFAKGKGKKQKRKRQNKKETGAGPFTLSVDTFEQFGLISLTPPTSIEQVENSVKELREKKEWYKNQPRGSVPTAKEIRKANEKAAAKLRQSAKKEETDKGQAKGKPGFSLSNEDFTPLGVGGATSSISSQWVQKPSTRAPALNE